MLVNEELDRLWKEAIVDSFNELSQNSSVMTEENSHGRYSVRGFQPPHTIHVPNISATKIRCLKLSKCETGSNVSVE
jgi:hypothetical protein